MFEWKLAARKSFERMILCRGYTNSLIDIHKSSLESSHLFETISFDSYFIQNQNFHIENQERCEPIKKWLHIILRKWDFNSKDSKWVFEMHFNEEHFEKRFLLKRKEIIRKWQYAEIKHRQPKRRQNHKVIFLFFFYFLVINKTNKGESKGQYSWFSNGLWKLNLTKDDQSDKLKP